MVRKVWMAVLILMMISASAVAEDLAVQLLVRPAMEPYPGLTWEADFQKTVKACCGADFVVIKDKDTGITAVSAPCAEVAGYMTDSAALLLNADGLGAVNYAFKNGCTDAMYETIRAYFVAQYGEPTEAQIDMDAFVEVNFAFDGIIGLPEAEDDEETESWWKKAVGTVMWPFSGEVADSCTWQIGGHTLLSIEYHKSNTALGSSAISVHYTEL